MDEEYRALLRTLSRLCLAYEGLVQDFNKREVELGGKAPPFGGHIYAKNARALLDKHDLSGINQPTPEEMAEKIEEGRLGSE